MNAAKTTRRQYWRNGKRLPSVTTILDNAAKPALLGWAAGCGARALARMLDDGVNIDAALGRVRIEWQKERKAAADAGSRAHELLEAWAKDEPADADLDNEQDREAHRLYQAGVAHLQATGSSILASEVGLKGHWSGEHDNLAFGGTFDLIIERSDGLWLADWKTGARVYGDSVVPQLAAYRELWRWLDLGWADPIGPDVDVGRIRNRSPEMRGALVLHIPYDGPITEHQVPHDVLDVGWRFFTACHTLHKLKPKMTIETDADAAKEAAND